MCSVSRNHDINFQCFYDVLIRSLSDIIIFILSPKVNCIWGISACISPQSGNTKLDTMIDLSELTEAKLKMLRKVAKLLGYPLNM